ncbi:MAG: OmpA family protein, partial [Bacteroidales bacterium]|nr:OmpA family protein [Bacteroidales bacterium]
MTNDTLSQRRAESCVNYLVDKGINPARLVAKGYGEKVPRTLHRNRVSNYGGQDYTFSMGTVLTPEYISALNGRNNQEAAHSLNRRTEFRILRDDFVPPSNTDSVDKTAIVQFIGTPGVSIINITIEGDLVKIPCIINSRTSEFSIENNSNKISFSHEEAMKLLKENRLSTADFEEKEAAFSPDGSIIEKSVLYLENLRIGEEDIENVHVEVVKGLKTTLVIGDKMLTEEFGKFEIDKEKKTITITKNSN